MEKIFLTAFANLCLVFAFAQDRVIHDANAEARNVTSFNSIKVSQGIELLLTHGSSEAVAVSADEKAHRDAIKTEVTNGELRIYIEQSAIKWWKQLVRKGEKPKAYVSYVNLEKINGTSGAKITVEGTINTAILSVDVSSGAILKSNVKAKKLSVEQSRGGKTYIGGNAENLDVNTSSGAHFFGYDLAVTKCKAEASSGGKIQLNVTNELVAYASSGGGIDYTGEGVIMDISTSSGGKVKKNK
jgi:hypothetical protein